MISDEHRRISADCTKVALQLSMLVDAGRYEDALELYTDDAVHSSSVQRVEGRAALAASFASRPASRVTRHLIFNTVIDVTGPTTATGISNVIVYRFAGAGAEMPDFPIPMIMPETVGEYHDAFRLHEGRWKLCSRRMIEVFDGRAELLTAAKRPS